MSVDQILLEKWRSLPPDKQQEVFDFVEFLQARQVSLQNLVVPNSQSNLGEKLLQIHEKITASGIPLLTDEEIERELIARRGGYQESE